MSEPIFEKIRRTIYLFIRLLTGHEYDCCGKWWKRCSNCDEMSMSSRLLMWIIKRLLILQYKIDPFFVRSYSISDEIDIHVIVETWKDGIHRYGTREEEMK